MRHKLNYFVLLLSLVLISKTLQAQQEPPLNPCTTSLESQQQSIDELVDAIQSNHLEDVKRLINLLKEKIDDFVNLRIYLGQTPLILAADKGYTKMVQFFIESGANPNLQAGSLGRTALMIAADKGYTEIAQSLIRSEAKLNLQDYLGRTALMFAARKHHRQIAQLLINSGAKVGIRDNFGNTVRTMTIDSQVIKLIDDKATSEAYTDE